ncbi:MAG TPA: ParB/RepB/Spo0J family partition protein [Candidatus Binataceae bacterium]|nr:ParB/RepB/Spo0J family partition protein [Candidatus Binataceae bacterium]
MTRRPLGRGLGALIEDSLEGVVAPGAAGGYRKVSVDSIAPSLFQPRRQFDPERMAQLAEAIAAQGVIEPLIVRPIQNGNGAEHYELVAGERRLRAARQAGLAEVPVVVRELDNKGALEVALVENLAREDLNAVEEARGLQRLAREFSLSHEQIAQRIGKSRPYVSNAMRLLELPEAILAQIEHGELSVGQARPLLGLASPGEQLAAARQIAAHKLSARGAEQIAAARRKPSAATVNVSKAADPHMQALIETLQRALKRKVRVDRQGKGPGRLEIEFYNDEDLTALAATLTNQHLGGASWPQP